MLMFNLLILLFLILFFYLAWKNFDFGIYLTVVLLPTYLIRFSILSLPSNLLEWLILILFIIWLLKLNQTQPITFNPLVWLKNLRSHNKLNNPLPKLFRPPLILFLIASYLATFYGPNYFTALGIWRAYFLEALIFFLICLHTLKTKEQVKKLIYALTTLALAIGIFGLIQKFTGWLIPNVTWLLEPGRRVTTFFGYPNANGLFLAPVILLIFGNLFDDAKNFLNCHCASRRSPLRGEGGRGVTKQSHCLLTFFQLLTITLGCLTIYWSRSAGAVAGVVAGIIAYLLFFKKTRIATLIIIGLIILGSLFTSLPAKIQKTYIGATEVHLPINPTSWQMRAQLWREDLKLLADHPVLGAGLTGYKTLQEKYKVNNHIETFLYPHNVFLNFYSEIGLLGLVAFIWILVAFFLFIKRGLLANDFLTIASACAMVALLIMGLVDVPYFKNDLSILFYLLILIPIILNQEGQKVN